MCSSDLDLGLAAALEWQAQEFESRTGIQCRILLPKELIVLDQERSTALFRIFQETLTNVARHADATSAEARLTREGDHLILRVHDNGRGYDPLQVPGRRSLGLVGMRERALILNGEFKIEGAARKGTTVTVRIPIPRSD